MTNPQQNRQRLKQLAQQGDPPAISTLMNRSFQSQNVQAAVTATESRLIVKLTGQSAPSPQLATAVQKGLLSLNLTQFAAVTVQRLS